VLVDPDVVEKKNLNRILNSTAADAAQAMPKARLMKRMIDALGRDQVVVPLHMNLDTVEAAERVAECDVLFGCVDTAEGRHLANRLAAYYLLPYIDVGVSLAADGKGRYRRSRVR
jgi:molybdopterin/thiamine biosynthesis adenylyltransferase